MAATMAATVQLRGETTVEKDIVGHMSQTRIIFTHWSPPNLGYAMIDTSVQFLLHLVSTSIGVFYIDWRAKIRNGPRQPEVSVHIEFLFGRDRKTGLPLVFEEHGRIQIH